MKEDILQLKQDKAETEMVFYHTRMNNAIVELKVLDTNINKENIRQYQLEQQLGLALKNKKDDVEVIKLELAYCLDRLTYLDSEFRGIRSKITLIKAYLSVLKEENTDLKAQIKNLVVS